MAHLTRTGLCVNRYCSTADFPFFKMAAVHHLGFLEDGNINFRSHSEAQYASPYQISRRSVKPFQRYGRFSIFQDGGRRHLGFWKFQIFNGCDAQEVELRLSAKFCRNRSNRGWDMAIFAIFQNGGRPPSWIGLTRVGTTHEEYLVVFVTLQNLVVIGAVISTVCKF